MIKVEKHLGPESNPRMFPSHVLDESSWSNWTDLFYKSIWRHLRANTGWRNIWEKKNQRDTFLSLGGAHFSLEDIYWFQADSWLKVWE